MPEGAAMAVGSPSSLGGWPAFGGVCQLRLSVMLPSQATVQMEGGKIVADFPNYHQTSEIVGDKLVEVSVLLVPGIMMRTLFCLQPWPLRAGPLGPGSVSMSCVPGSVLSTWCRSSGLIFRATC